MSKYRLQVARSPTYQSRCWLLLTTASGEVAGGAENSSEVPLISGSKAEVHAILAVHSKRGGVVDAAARARRRTDGRDHRRDRRRDVHEADAGLAPRRPEDARRA